MKVVISIILFFVLPIFTEANKGVWNYKENGPDEWPYDYAECKGLQQSPIDLQTSIAVYNKKLKPINFNNYNQYLSWNISNDGTSIYGNLINSNKIPYINGSNFEEDFYLSQFHFHWGYNPYQGSEHQMNGNKYPLEIHLVHQSKSGKFAVVGFFYSLDKTNVRLDDFVDVVGQVIYKFDTTTININLLNILPDIAEANKNGYFRYIGSLTTPPCTEGIIWTVYRQTVPISIPQLKGFYSNKVESNHRHIQPLNGRKLEISVETKGFDDQKLNNLLEVLKSLLKD